MLMVIIDAVTLITLLKTVCDEDMGLGQACLLAFLASIGPYALALGGDAAMGIVGLLVWVVIAAGILGAVLSWLLGAEIKRAFITAGIFMLVHLGCAFGLQMLMN